MFRSRRQLRHWSAAVLLLWFFGIGSAFANACLNASDRPAQGATIGAHHAAAAAQPGAADDPAPAKTNCQDFCDKTSISIPPLKAALDHAYAGPAHPPPLAVLCVVAACDPVQRWVPRVEARVAPPIAIAFLRLAL